MTERTIYGFVTISILALALSFYESPPGTLPECLSPEAIAEMEQ